MIGKRQECIKKGEGDLKVGKKKRKTRPNSREESKIPVKFKTTYRMFFMHF